MNLYELGNGWTGQSYVRVYAWAPDEKTAREMAGKQECEGQPFVPIYCDKLFSREDSSFCTRPSGDGWSVK